jgi:hypothetical protein
MKNSPKTGNKGKEKTRQGITNRSSTGGDVLMFGTMSAKKPNYGS